MFNDPSSMVAVVMLALVGSVIFCVAVLPVILQIPTAYVGEITSISQRDFGVQTTVVNFKDGSTVTLLGLHNIPLGNHTFSVTSSWFFTGNLKQFDGAVP